MLLRLGLLVQLYAVSLGQHCVKYSYGYECDDTWRGGGKNAWRTPVSFNVLDVSAAAFPASFHSPPERTQLPRASGLGWENCSATSTRGR
eukprot:scaffold32551_cov21-Prasinocladus_malaysianus.AAC.1